jgi:thioredoxin 1
MSTLPSVNEEQFETEVLQANLPTLVDFWAPWCRPCQMLTPLLEELMVEYQGKMNFFKMNVDENTSSPAKFGVRGIPTMIIFKNGKVAGTKVGFITKSQIDSFINSYL